MNNPALPSQLNSMLSANTDPSAPQAYLNYLVFDQNLQLIPAKSGAVQVPTGSGSGIPWTTIRPSILDGELLRVEVPGYIVIYINNNSIGKDVYFDDIKIEHYNGNVLEESHYYPFGLTVSQAASGATAPANPYKYQGIELERNFGLEQYETPNRGLNPQIGRFMQIDPMANITYSQSPYASMDNNPVIYTDPDGLFSRFGAWWRNVVWGGDGIEKNKKTGEWGVRSSGENWDGSFMTQVTYNGKPTAFPSQIKEHLKQQLEFEDAMQQTGIETKWVDNVGEARKDMLNFSASLMVGSAPQLNVAKTAKAASAVEAETSNISKVVNAGKQGKHIVGHNNYQVGKSILSENAQGLLDAFHSGKINTSQVINEVKTRVDFGKVIGTYINPQTGEALSTTKGIIINSKTGVHIVPAAP